MLSCKWYLNTTKFLPTIELTTESFSKQYYFTQADYLIVFTSKFLS